MWRLLLGGSHRLQIPQQTGLQQIDQSCAIAFRAACLPDAGKHASHTDLHHALIIVVLHVIRVRDDGIYFAELQVRGRRLVCYQGGSFALSLFHATHHLRDVVDNVRIGHREQISGSRQIALGEHFRKQFVHLVASGCLGLVNHFLGQAAIELQNRALVRAV